MEGAEKGFSEALPKYEPPKAEDPDYPPPEYQPSEYPTGGYRPTHPPPSQSYQVASGQTTVIITHQHIPGPLAGSTNSYMDCPALIVCQHCQAIVTTSREYQVGLLTWGMAGVLCLFGLWLGCCLIPFCINSTKDVLHKCPNCKKIVGKFTHF